MRSKLRVLAVAAMSLALVALGSIGASTAMAEKPNNHCLGLDIMGNGSSLQVVAQNNVWRLGFEKVVCPGGTDEVLEYLGGGSAAGLHAFGLELLEKPETSGEAYIGTDDAPNEAQLKEMEEAAEGGFKNANSQDLVIPVAQAAIAILVKPPTNCLITQIRNVDLELVFNGLLLLWSEIEGVTEDAAKACEVEIMRDVRFDGSGTTYQFKHYLSEINKGLLDGSQATKGWEELQPEEVPNLEWPEGTELTPVLKPLEAGGKKEVELVKADENSIGYANLADARGLYEAGKLEWVQVQTNGSETLAEEEAKLLTATFEPPGTAATEPSGTPAEANCKETEYTNIPAKAEEPDADWSKTYGGHPHVVKGHYPICTLTWDVALINYELAKVPEAAEVGQTVYDYLRYVTSESAEGGQKEISNKHDYLGLFTSPTNVLEIALKLSLLVAGGPREGLTWKVGGSVFEPGSLLWELPTPWTALVEVPALKWHWEGCEVLLVWHLYWPNLWEWLEVLLDKCLWLKSNGTETCEVSGTGEVKARAEANSATTALFLELTLKLPTENDSCLEPLEKEIAGNLEGNWKNTGEELEFPATALSGTTLLGETNPAILVGTAKELLPGGSTLALENLTES